MGFIMVLVMLENGRMLATASLLHEMAFLPPPPGFADVFIVSAREEALHEVV
jgi:hypothetical protein